ncbi:MAG TPA: lysophospholipid acyltransferase family protein [Selenomonadales bacterium]|nr:lysophospholipid acyltransferase family protein [Selenomonadales bacterium]
MVYKILHSLLGLIFCIVFRWRITGVENIPATGGLIVASNHISLWDPPLIGCALPTSRKIHFMAKAELFSWPVFRWVITELGAFPVRRGAADRNAIRTALGLVEAGGVFGIFPEGTRSKTGELGQAAPGMAMIALKAGVPIVPTAVRGTNKVFCDGHLFPQFEIRFGKPICLPEGRNDREGVEYVNRLVMQEIARLMRSEGG